MREVQRQGIEAVRRSSTERMRYQVPDYAIVDYAETRQGQLTRLDDVLLFSNEQDVSHTRRRHT